ncbi:MAG: hypothetical protein ACK5PS_15775 [Desulfopila sp.]
MAGPSTIDEDENLLMYHVYGTYPGARFYYDEQADMAVNPDGWCDYSSESVALLSNGETIQVKDGLKMVLAYRRDGQYLEPGRLAEDNKLVGEGPFRVVPPQKRPGPPDQRLTAVDQNVVWSFDDRADHNGGYATRSATLIKVDPLPPGTTDIDIMEAGWSFVDEGKILVYGALDPRFTMLDKLGELSAAIAQMDVVIFGNGMQKRALLHRVEQIVRAVNGNRGRAVDSQLANLIKKVDGCSDGGAVDMNDWIVDCDSQVVAYWSLREVRILNGDQQ